MNPGVLGASGVVDPVKRAVACGWAPPLFESQLWIVAHGCVLTPHDCSLYVSLGRSCEHALWTVFPRPYVCAVKP